MMLKQKLKQNTSGKIISIFFGLSVGTIGDGGGPHTVVSSRFFRIVRTFQKVLRGLIGRKIKRSHGTIRHKASIALTCMFVCWYVTGAS